HSDIVDPVGACVGPKGQRVQTIVDELNGEKIDIVRWSEDPKEFVRNALSPAQVVAVYVNEPAKSTTVVVPDYQLSLAIGKRGQNARLAAKLTGWKIDIKSETDAEALDLFDTFAEKVESEPEIVQNEVEQDLSDATVETTAVKEEE
ncbi:MAG: transcription termination/antitermination protein NusA, partial [Exiguobacterium sp.]|nr:transcription termination/antitermination protein NusA [Exiguobacterium sp.]